MVPVIEAAESPEHKRLVVSLIAHIKKEGFAITCAANPMYNQCDETEGRIPDVRGKNTDELNAIGEAKTCDDLNNERTKEQFKVFSNREMSDGRSKGKTVPFYIAIPKECENELKTTLHDLGLDAKENIRRVLF
jgi:hypothetical protein